MLQATREPWDASLLDWRVDVLVLEEEWCHSPGDYSDENICPPKQYLNRKDGTAITDPKDIANKHAAVFTGNSSSAHYSATFQAIKEQEEKVKIGLHLRQHRSLQQTLPIERFEAINREG